MYILPRLLLADEPDSHLHPDRQESLVKVLYEAAKHYGCQVIMTTHSPSIIRAMPTDSKLLWMKNGAIIDDDASVRTQMGWGLLDKTVLLLTEDKKTKILEALIHQWPEVQRKVAVWPLHGITTLPSADSLSGMRKIFGDSLKLAMHRDGDFLTTGERTLWKQPYSNKDVSIWITEGSDIESCFISTETIAHNFNVTPAVAEEILQEGMDRIPTWGDTFRDKRQEINRNNKIYPSAQGTPTQIQAIDDLCIEFNHRKYVGKTLANKVRAVAQDRGLDNVSSFASKPKAGFEIASDLKVFLEGLI